MSVSSFNNQPKPNPCSLEFSLISYFKFVAILIWSWFESRMVNSWGRSDIYKVWQLIRIKVQIYRPIQLYVHVGYILKNGPPLECSYHSNDLRYIKFKQTQQTKKSKRCYPTSSRCCVYNRKELWDVRLN